MIMKPREHQLDFARFHNREGEYASIPMMIGSMAWHGMGLGKTSTSLWEARKVLSKVKQLGAKAPKFMVICPKSAIPTWKAECHKVTPELSRDMIVYPYSQMHHASARVKHADIRLVIFDEWHYVKEPKTQRAGRLAEMLKAIEAVNGRFLHGRVLLLTGTPLPNNAAELYTSWAICTAPNLTEAANRIVDETRYEEWRSLFSNRKDINWTIGKSKPKHLQKQGFAVKYTGVSNEDKLNQMLRPFVHFKRVEDCIDLPEKQEIEIDLEIPDDTLLQNIDIDRPEAYMALVERLSRAKTPHMIEWVQDYLHANEDQLIVFALNKHPIETLREKFPKHVRLITGAETNAERAQNLADFQNGVFRILGLTYACGAESLNAQNCFRTLYHGYPWNDAKRRQAMARTYRQGQKNCTQHFFLMSGENDRHILNLVRAKGETEKRVEDMLLLPNTRKITLDDLI